MPEPVDIEGIFRRHMTTVYRVCYSYLGSTADAEDATQSVFMKLVVSPRAFADEEHEKAWLIRCAANHCKDVLKSPRRTRAAAMPREVVDERMSERPGTGSDTLDAVMRLPEVYRVCVYLCYYEGYRTDEIAAMVDAPPSTVRNRLSDARKMLREALGGNGPGGEKPTSGKAEKGKAGGEGNGIAAIR